MLSYEFDLNCNCEIIFKLLGASSITWLCHIFIISGHYVWRDTVFGSSLESIWRWKSEKILNKQTIAWKVLCTLFTHRSISVGSSNFFAASKNFRYTGSITRVKKRPTRNIHIATQSSDCSWENQEFNHLATSFYQYLISICLKIDETHIRSAVLFRGKRS